MGDINFWAVLVAAAANFIIGFLLHGPIGGNLWMRLANIKPTGNEKFADMVPQMIWNFVANIVFAFVLAQMISFNGLVDASKGMIFAVFVWMGYVVTSTSMDVIWMGKSWKLWAYEVFSSLLSIVAMGAILASW